MALCLAWQAPAALARRDLIPEQPSVEIHLDVLQALRHRGPGETAAPSSFATPFHNGHSAAAPPSPTARRAPRLNAPSSSHATMPPQRVLPPPPPTQAQGFAVYEPAAPQPDPAFQRPSRARPAAKPRRLIQDEPPPPAQPKPRAKPKPEPEKAKPEPAPEAAIILPQPPDRPAPKPDVKPEAAPAPAPDVIEPAPAEPDLPEPNLDAMEFEDFPELEPLPQPEPLPDEPQEPAMPALSDSLDDFISDAPDADAPVPEPVPEPEPDGLPDPSALIGDDPGDLPSGANDPLPPLDAITGDAPPAILPPSEGGQIGELPPMPAFDDTPSMVDSPMPDLPPPAEIAAVAQGEPLPDMPTVQPPGEPEAAQPRGPAAELSIEFAETENEIPVSAQPKLNELATRLIQTEENVRIRPFVGGTTEEAALANVIGTRRAFAIRTYLIDKGVSHFNISIDRNQVSQDGSPERVELVIE